jgi:hypothetical protein
LGNCRAALSPGKIKLTATANKINSQEKKVNSRQNEIKGPITWSIFNPGVELSPVYRVEISALSVIQNSIKVKRAITWQNFQPRAEIIMSYSSMRGSDYLLQENKTNAFLLPGIDAENLYYSVSTPGLKSSM